MIIVHKPLRRVGPSQRRDRPSERRRNRPNQASLVRAIELARYDQAWGRDFAARSESNGEKILAEVISRIGDFGLGVVKERVEGTLAGIQLSPVTNALNLN